MRRRAVGATDTDSYLISLITLHMYTLREKLIEAMQAYVAGIMGGKYGEPTGEQVQFCGVLEQIVEELKSRK